MRDRTRDLDYFFFNNYVLKSFLAVTIVQVKHRATTDGNTQIGFIHNGQKVLSVVQRRNDQGCLFPGTVAVITRN